MRLMTLEPSIGLCVEVQIDIRHLRRVVLMDPQIIFLGPLGEARPQCAIDRIGALDLPRLWNLLVCAAKHAATLERAHWIIGPEWTLAIQIHLENSKERASLVDVNRERRDKRAKIS